MQLAQIVWVIQIPRQGDTALVQTHLPFPAKVSVTLIDDMYLRERQEQRKEGLVKCNMEENNMLACVFILSDFL